MLHFKLTLFAVLWAGSSAQQAANLRSRSLLENIAGYTPTTLVTDQNAVDLDQKAMEAIMGAATDAAFTAGLAIYSKGGNSGSYAKLTLGAVLTGTLPKAGDAVTGVNAAGTAVNGKVLADYTAGSTSLSVTYDVSDVQITHSTCRVGGLNLTLTTGCFAPSGNIKVNNGANIAYTYAVATDNLNSRTLKTLSTGAATLQTDAGGKYYPYFQKYVDYYGATDYADKMIMAAFEGKSITLKNALFDFVNHPLRARDQQIKKTSAYTTMVMTVIGHMERAIENCVANKEALSSLDQAVAYYTGSDEGQLTGGTASGWVLHNHADRRCGGFKTCGANRDAVNGTAKVNFEMAEVFNNMKTALTAKNCAAAKTAATTGMATLLIPQIQGALRYTRVLNTRTNYTGHETAEAEGASFAAGVLPMIGACNPAAATTIWSNLRFKIASPPNLVAVKAAFESTYKCLGITCADVGGQWNGTQYLTDAGPCVDVVAPTPVAVPAPTPATAPKAPTPTAPSAPKAPSAAAPAAAPVKPTESVGPIRRIIRRIRKFFGNLFG